MEILVVYGGYFCVGVTVFGILFVMRKLSGHVDKAWSRVASGMGLRLERGTLGGRLHGHWVEATRRTDLHGLERAIISCRLRTPLDLGLMLHREDRPKLATELSGGAVLDRDQLIGDYEFDERYHVAVDEVERAKTLLTPRVRQVLDQRMGAATFVLTDQGVAIELLAHHHPGWMRWALEAAVAVCHEIEGAQPDVPVATTLAPHRPAWATFARQHHLRLHTTPLCMWGQMDNLETRVHTTRTAPGQFAVDVELRFSERLEVGLLLQPVGTVDRVRLFFGGKDHTFGDSSFDETFIVQLVDEDKGERLLDAATRAQLLRLHMSVGPLSLDDESLSVRLPNVPHEPERFLNTVGELGALAQHIELTATGRTKQGPYR